MKRIARLGTESYAAGEMPIAHDELVRLLRTQLSPAVASLFARPKAVEGGLVEWYSDLGGQPVPFSQLPPGEAVQVQHLLEERIAAIRQLADRLEAQGGEGVRQAALLRQAVQYPDTRTLYSLNGQPVLTFWGHRLAGGAPAGAVPQASGGPRAAGVPLATGLNSTQSGPDGVPPLSPAPPGAPEPPGRKRRWWPWLLLLLLLALLAGLLCWLLNREEEIPPVEPPIVEEPIEEAAEQEPVEEPALEDEPPSEEPPVEEPPIAEPVLPEPEAVSVAPEPEPEPPAPDPFDELSGKIAATTDCAALEKLLKEEPLLQGNEAPAQELKQKIRSTLEGRCKQEQARQQQARQAQIQQAKNLCPGHRPQELAPELIIVFDASGSMRERLPLTAQEQLQRQVTKDVIGGLSGMIGGSTGRTIGRQVEKSTIGDPPTRMSAAKEAAASVVKRTPRDMNIGLVIIDNCPAAVPAGYYTPAQRGSLLSRLQAMQPRGGTPLGDAISKAGQMLDGVNRASVMVVISDGQASCGKDPCGVARQLAASKPNLKINVVDIMGAGAGNCVAQATGGRVFTAKSVKDLNLMVTQAAQEVLGPGNCP